MEASVHEFTRLDLCSSKQARSCFTQSERSRLVRHFASQVQRQVAETSCACLLAAHRPQIYTGNPFLYALLGEFVQCKYCCDCYHQGLSSHSSKVLCSFLSNIRVLQTVVCFQQLVSAIQTPVFGVSSCQAGEEILRRTTQVFVCIQFRFYKQEQFWAFLN